MFRLGIAVLAVVGLVSLISGAAGWAVAGGLFLLAPLFFVFKIMFFLMMFGMFKAAFAHRRGYRNEGPWGWRPRPVATSNAPSEKERFDEWHRMDHARQEVDSWVNPTVDEEL
ncbi:MAG: hypothetical protein HKN91_10350 [Acidimicrobiia bacterium]|nr:hypothetical protein [Acidimicrobiia bacterium]